MIPRDADHHALPVPVAVPGPPLPGAHPPGPGAGPTKLDQCTAVMPLLMLMLMAKPIRKLILVQGVEWRNYLGFYSLRSHDTLKVGNQHYNSYGGFKGENFTVLLAQNPESQVKLSNIENMTWHQTTFPMTLSPGCPCLRAGLHPLQAADS